MTIRLRSICSMTASSLGCSRGSSNGVKLPTTPLCVVARSSKSPMCCLNCSSRPAIYIVQKAFSRSMECWEDARSTLATFAGRDFCLSVLSKQLAVAPTQDYIVQWAFDYCIPRRSKILLRFHIAKLEYDHQSISIVRQLLTLKANSGISVGRSLAMRLK